AADILPHGLGKVFFRELHSDQGSHLPPWGCLRACSGPCGTETEGKTMVNLSNRVAKLKSSSIMEIAARAQTLKSQGVDVVSLAAGEPDFNTPKAIQEAATKAMADGITKNTP